MISNTTDGKLVSDLSAENGSERSGRTEVSDLTSADGEKNHLPITLDAQNNSRAAILPVDTEDKAKLNSQKSILKPGSLKKKTATFKTFRS